jgi:16S rRNA (uracil1498-N3)-methyltransferase
VNPVLRGSAAHVFVESLESPQLTDEDEHHLRRVLRIREGDAVTLGDGAGSWVTARLTADGLSITSDPDCDREPQPSVILSAIPKGDRPEWMVQKLTELGATAIGFIECARSVVRWEAPRADRQMQRLRRIARESAMQSRRLWLPQILDVVPFAEAAASATCAIADPHGGRLTDELDTILVGPEGGFTDRELESVTRRVALSPNVLRVETAALAAAFLLTQRAQ